MSEKPIQVGPMLYLRVWARMARTSGLRVMFRSIRLRIEEAFEARGVQYVMRATRLWHLGWIAVGVAIAASAPVPARDATGFELLRLFEFAAVVGLGVAVALRALAMLLASFSANLLIHRFTASFRPSVVRAIVIALVGFVAARFGWPAGGWVAVALLAVAWIVWPLLHNAVVAASAPRHFMHRMMPVSRLMAMSARKLPPEARRLVAVHEAGHAVFFGLGDRVPHDLLAFLADEIPPLEEVTTSGERDRSFTAGGAVDSFDALAEKSLALDLRRAEFEALLGMMCGGAAAEQSETGQHSASTVGDVAAFEGKARLFLSVYPDERWPYVVQPQGEHEGASNAASLARFREHMRARAVEFVAANRASVNAIAEALLAKGELNVDDLKVLLSSVTPAGGFERFRWSPDLPGEPFSPAEPATERQ